MFSRNYSRPVSKPAIEPASAITENALRTLAHQSEYHASEVRKYEEIIADAQARLSNHNAVLASINEALTMLQLTTTVITSVNVSIESDAARTSEINRAIASGQREAFARVAGNEEPSVLGKY